MDSQVWDKDPDDYYTEPEALDESIFAQESFVGEIVDPACGSGRIVRAARAAGYEALGTDKVRRCDECDYVKDFLESDIPRSNFVCNPPFSIADAFIKHALTLAKRKVVMILPARYTFSEKRSRWLATTPLRRVLACVPRPSMPPGRLIEAGMKPGGGKSDFSVLIWQINYDGAPEFGWLRRVANDNIPAQEQAA
jgi:hypothetical protein